MNKLFPDLQDFFIRITTPFFLPYLRTLAHSIINIDFSFFSAMIHFFMYLQFLSGLDESDVEAVGLRCFETCAHVLLLEHGSGGVGS